MLTLPHLLPHLSTHAHTAPPATSPQVSALSAAPHTLASTDALRVALALASWRSPTPANPTQKAQQQLQQSRGVASWVQQALSAHQRNASCTASAAASALALRLPVAQARTLVSVMGAEVAKLGENAAAALQERAGFV